MEDQSLPSNRLWVQRAHLQRVRLEYDFVCMTVAGDCYHVSCMGVGLLLYSGAIVGDREGMYHASLSCGQLAI